MFARPLALLLCLLPLVAYSQTRVPYGPLGFELPERVTPEKLSELSLAMRQAKCETQSCRVLRIAIGEVVTNPNQRKNPGTIWNGRAPDIPYAAIKAREIDKSLAGIKALWPELCSAVVEIGARDDFVHGHETFSGIATSVLDVARHLTRPGLDCLGQALAAMPESKFLQASKYGAYNYCVDEGRGAARCARLKPTDPDFLPAPPFKQVR
ncbi:MAG: hypothetical protein NT133_05510 [Alphaproteobacteria bacterium]|nr:hypothetical protein [Alphaproteobacteria bacterium]